MLTPDLCQASAFLQALDHDPGARFGFATFDDRGDDPRLACRLYGDLTSATRLTGKKAGQRVQTANFLAFMQGLGAGVFATVNEIDGRGARAENVMRVRSMIADADTVGQVASLHQFIARTGLQPTITVESGGLAIKPDGDFVPKLQAYWHVQGCQVEQFTPGQQILNSRTGCDPSIKDLARVLRLPSFWHQKREPRITRSVEVTGAAYDFASFMRHARTAPAVAPVMAAHGRPRVVASGAAVASPATRDRLRALVAQHGGHLRPAVAAFLAEAHGPGDEGGGNRHATLLTAVGALVAYGWPDLAIHTSLTVEADRLWSGTSRRARVQSMLDFARGREEAAAGTPPTPSQVALARAFGGGRG